MALPSVVDLVEVARQVSESYFGIGGKAIGADLGQGGALGLEIGSLVGRVAEH